MTPSPSAIAARRRAFRELHAAGCFVIPNPWDAGSARYLATLGFRALATTSSGFAWSRAQADGAMSRDAVLAHLREMVAATDLPVNADFESGYGATPADVAQSVRLAVDTGVAGLSIEDSTGDAAHPIHDLDMAVDAPARGARGHRGHRRRHAAGRPRRELPARPARSGRHDRPPARLRRGRRRLPLCAGHSHPRGHRAVVAAVAPKPVNLLVGWPSELSLADIAALGVRRVSVGGALARSAWGGFMRAAQSLAQDGRFDGFAGAAGGAELNALFR